MLVKTESTNERALLFYKEKGFLEEGKTAEELNNRNVELPVLKLFLRKTYENAGLAQEGGFEPSNSGHADLYQS